MDYPVGYNRSLMIFLLVVNVIRVGHCSPENELTPVAEATGTTTTTTTPTAGDQPPPANNDNPSIFSKCKINLYKTISSLGRGTGMIMKAFSQAALTVFGFLVDSYDIISSTTATTGERVAQVVGMVNSTTSRLVLVRDVTSGAATLVDNLANTFRLNTDINIKNREQMVDKLDIAIENYHPESEPFLMPSTNSGGGADGKTADKANATVAAAAPPKNGVDQTTDATATADAPVTPPV